MLKPTSAASLSRARHPQVVAATLRRSFSRGKPSLDDGGDESQAGMNDLILSILQANPSTRDAKNYLGTFGNASKPSSSNGTRPVIPPSAKNPLNLPADVFNAQGISNGPKDVSQAWNANQHAALALLNPTQRRTALVKFQGPFTERQLESISRGMVYLKLLGLVSVIVVERDDWLPGSDGERAQAKDEVLRIAAALESQGAKVRPILDPVVRLGPPPRKLVSNELDEDVELDVPAHSRPSDLIAIRAALKAGEIPVVAPVAFDSFSRMVRINSNDVISALVMAMVSAGRAGQPDQLTLHRVSEVAVIPSDTEIPQEDAEEEVDMTPLRLMIINREGGIPSYARQGLPHLLINLTSEQSHIERTFDSSWTSSHPTSLSNLSLSRKCLEYMPPASSAIIVSHRSPRSLIANLITNKPAQSSSLPAYLLTSGTKKVTPHTPTLIRRGLPMRVISRDRMHEIDRKKLTDLLEASFKRVLQAEAFYSRLEDVLDYVIVAGDYAGACIVTEEPIPSPSSPHQTLSYLDKFAVHPAHQGDGTVDFLWVALHDESFGCGLAHALNPNEGGKMGLGTGRDLVWRSRTNNPANRWYYERSSGHLRLGEKGEWTMFWCDAEERMTSRENQLSEEGWWAAKACPGRRGRFIEGLSFVEHEEQGRMSDWADVVAKIPSSWNPVVEECRIGNIRPPL